MAVSHNRVLVTYGWVSSSYVAVRNLVEHGVEVIVADSNSVGMCQWSKYPTKCLRYTSHYEDERQFIDDIKRICSEQNVGLILGSHLSEPEWATSNYWLNTLVLDDDSGEVQRGFLELANSEGIMTSPAWTPLPLLPLFSDCPKMDLTITESMARRVVNIPSTASL